MAGRRQVSKSQDVCAAISPLLRGLIAKIPDARVRARRRAFTRQGPISPEFLVGFLLFTALDGGRRGIGHLLEDFWEQSASSGAPLPTSTPVSQASVCDARRRLSHEVFRDLLWALNEQLRKAAPGKRWRGKRVYAVDGRKLNLNRSEQVQRAFPAPKGAHCPQALYSLLIDVCERLPIDFELDSVNTSEREHLGRMLDSLECGAVLLLDRGYPAHELLRELLERGLDFVIRVPASSTFTAVDRFRSSGAKDARVTIEAQCAEHAPLGLRLVRREGRDGPAFYLTNLRRSEFDRAAIAELYRMRWQVEECFKLTASALLDQGLFRSRSENGVRQEIEALTLLIALSRALATAVDAAHDKPAHRTSQKAAVIVAAKLVVLVALRANPRALDRALARAVERLLRAQEAIREPRSFPRRSMLPVPKWGPSGRRGG